MIEDKMTGWRLGLTYLGGLAFCVGVWTLIFWGVAEAL